MDFEFDKKPELFDRKWVRVTLYFLVPALIFVLVSAAFACRSTASTIRCCCSEIERFARGRFGVADFVDGGRRTILYAGEARRESGV